MDLVGKVIALLPEVKMKSGKTKYGFVIETDGDYSQKIPFDVWGEERWQKLDVKLGAKVSVSFEIRGSEWKERYFVSLGAWRVQTIEGGVEHAPKPESKQEQPKKEEVRNETDNSSDGQTDLPF